MNILFNLPFEIWRIIFSYITNFNDINSFLLSSKNEIIRSIVSTSVLTIEKSFRYIDGSFLSVLPYLKNVERNTIILISNYRDLEVILNHNFLTNCSIFINLNLMSPSDIILSFIDKRKKIFKDRFQIFLNKSNIKFITYNNIDRKNKYILYKISKEISSIEIESDILENIKKCSSNDNIYDTLIRIRGLLPNININLYSQIIKNNRIGFSYKYIHKSLNYYNEILYIINEDFIDLLGKNTSREIKEIFNYLNNLKVNLFSINEIKKIIYKYIYSSIILISSFGGNDIYAFIDNSLENFIKLYGNNSEVNYILSLNGKLINNNIIEDIMSILIDLCIRRKYNDDFYISSLKIDSYIEKEKIS